MQLKTFQGAGVALGLINLGLVFLQFGGNGDLGWVHLKAHPRRCFGCRYLLSEASRSSCAEISSLPARTRQSRDRRQYLFDSEISLESPRIAPFPP
jgi:hypothetical protein